jgi:hypothetical protein
LIDEFDRSIDIGPSKQFGYKQRWDMDLILSGSSKQYSIGSIASCPAMMGSLHLVTTLYHHFVGLKLPRVMLR